MFLILSNLIHTIGCHSTRLATGSQLTLQVAFMSTTGHFPGLTGCPYTTISTAGHLVIFTNTPFAALSVFFTEEINMSKQSL